MLCVGCGCINNRLNPFCDRCLSSFGDRPNETLTAADYAYLEWKRAKDQQHG